MSTAKKPRPEPDEKKKKKRDPTLPIGQHEGEGTNAVTRHTPDPSAEPDADGEHRYEPRTGYIHGND